MQAGRCLLMLRVTLIAGDSIVGAAHAAMSVVWQQAALGQACAGPEQRTGEREKKKRTFCLKMTNL